MVAAGLGTVVFASTMVLLPWQLAVLTAWDATSAVVVIWVFAATAAVASLATVGFGLLKAAEEHGVAKGTITALAVLSVALSWAVVQATFMLHYARLYYNDDGGIDFNEPSAPDYRDFAYLALTIGMTDQVSDTDLTSKPLRRAATQHALLSYVFGTVIEP